MEFGVLGPLEVRLDGRTVAISSRKHRVLLAALLLYAGRPVPVAELIDTIWDTTSPSDPRRTVQVYVTRLRTLLEAAAAGAGTLIVTTTDGYLIDVAEGHVDLLRFRGRLAAADRAAELADLDAEAVTLAAALAEWRGEPLADVPSERLQREVSPQLREQRLQALERRFDVDLRRGRHADVVDELVALTSQQPLRERLWSLLMTALHRSGRRGDALAAYHTVRRHLTEDLGVEPAEELRRLHATILAGGPTSGAGRPVDLPPVPRQLPPDVRGFAGRVAQLARLDALLPGGDGGEQGAVVTGAPGVGKTTLAVHWARRVADAFPDGQLWCNLRGYHPGQAATPVHALTWFLGALGVPGARIPFDLDEQMGLYRSLMDGRRMLVVLDNAHSPEQVRPLLPGAPGCLVVVTSRSRLTGLVAAEGMRPLTLDVLSDVEAGEMLARRLGAARVAAEPRAVADIIAGCARLPLALAVASAHAAAQPGFHLTTLATELCDAGGGLDAFDSGEPATNVRSVFSWSYRTLSGGAARLFRLLGLHPGPDIAVPAAASLIGTPVDRVRPLLVELVRAHLITEPAPGRYAFHDLLRAYAAELARARDSAADRRCAVHRMLDHYLHTAYAGARLLQPSRDAITLAPPEPAAIVVEPATYDEAMAWFAAEHQVLLAVVDQAATTGWDTHTWQLAWALTNVLYRRGHWRDRVAVEHAAVAAARRLGDPTAQAHAHRNLAGAYTWLGRFDDARRHYRDALELATQSGDRAMQAHIHEGIAFLWGRQGSRHAEALTHAQRALDLYRSAGRRHGQADALNQVAMMHTLLGDHRQALIHSRQALALHRELDNRYGQAATLDTLGQAHDRLGHHPEALACYRRALDLLNELGERYPQADVLTRIGDTHHTVGDPHAARDAWRRALAILDDLDHPEAGAVRAKLAAVQ